MSISGALSNAVSGLRAASRGTEVVSSNIANALTPGYARRALELASGTSGGLGRVRVLGVSRNVDPGLLADKRLAEAETALANGRSQFYARLEGLLGLADDPASLTSGITRLESSLISAASRPDAPERLSAVAFDAADLAAKLNAASRGIQEMRTQADRDIKTQVDTLNTALQQVVDLNNRVVTARVQGGDDATLQDQRQQIIDQIAQIVPVRVLPRQNGTLALYTMGGAVLVDGSAADIGFTASNIVTPYMSLAASTLSGLTVNGQPVRTDAETGALRGGSLGAAFDVRDALGPEAQREIDAMARDLIERFQDPSVDPTRAATDPGLFTDGGAFFDPLNEVGLSERLMLNAVVDPRNGGEPWRLRDGINAAGPGPVGDPSQLNRLSDALTLARPVPSGSYAGVSFGAADLAGQILSGTIGQRDQADQQQAFAAARLTEFTERFLADGVDTDAELQNLLRLEQTYAANARVVQTIEELMDELLRL